MINQANRTQNTPNSKLWTWDFTIITLGSAMSFIGGTLSGFGLSVMALDYTGSTFLYALFNAAYQLPMLICPVLAGPYLDRASRKKAIYKLDYLSAGLFAGLFLLLRGGWFNAPVLLAFSLLRGTIDGVYMVAYNSLYPNLVDKKNLSKAYSISSILESVTAAAYPAAALIYETLGGAGPLFAVNSVCFFIAACFERRVQYQETHMADAPRADGLSAWRRYCRELRDGAGYIAREKGLLAITLYFMASNFAGGGIGSLHLPFFRSHAALYAAWPAAAVTLYSVVSSFAEAGRFAGGLIHYKAQIPAARRFNTAVAVYVMIGVLDAVMLFLPVPAMAAAFFVQGIIGITSYNIRIAATQSYVPDSRRARFNGAFQMLIYAGSVSGTLLAGGLAEFLPERGVILLLSAAELVCVWLFIYRGRRDAAAVYNREA